MVATAIAEPKKLERTNKRKKNRAYWSRQGREQVLPRMFLLILGAYYMLPFYWMIVSSLKPNSDLTANPPRWLPSKIQWSNYSKALDVFPFWTFFANSVIITVISVIGVAITVPMVAYGFSRIEWPGRDKVFFVVLATVFIPYPALIIALFDIFAKLHWVNTFYPLIVPFFFCFLPAPFWIFLMRQFFLQVPQEISDAAKIDGASELRIMFQIVMPQAWPALCAVCLFATLDRWNDFLGPLLYLNDPKKYTLSIGLKFFQSQSTYDIQFNLLMAASALVVLPVLILFFAFQRFFVDGVSLGAIK
ncbi:MAG: carbohydrate ABC transporter permease [Thermomicrobiales bacterium]